MCGQRFIGLKTMNSQVSTPVCEQTAPRWISRYRNVVTANETETLFTGALDENGILYSAARPEPITLVIPIGRPL